MKVKKLSLKALIRHALINKKNTPAYHPFFKIVLSVKNKIKRKGLNVDDFYHTITSYAIRHIIAEHGDTQKENKKKQIAVTLDAFEKIPKIIKNYDSVSVITKNGKTHVVYKKKINNNYFYVEEILKGKKELTTKTLYIKKA